MGEKTKIGGYMSKVVIFSLFVLFGFQTLMADSTSSATATAGSAQAQAQASAGSGGASSSATASAG